MQQAVIGTVSGIDQSIRISEALKNAGFTNDEISILMPDEYGAQELGYEKHSKAPESFSLGVIIGATLGAIVGYLVATGVLLIPHPASLIAAGPLLSALSCAAIGGLIGGLIGTVFGLSLPKYEAKKYERKIRYGNTLMSVHTDNAKEVKVAEEIFKTEGAQDINLTSEESVKKKAAQLAA